LCSHDPIDPTKELERDALVWLVSMISSRLRASWSPAMTVTGLLRKFVPTPDEPRFRQPRFYGGAELLTEAVNIKFNRLDESSRRVGWLRFFHQIAAGAGLECQPYVFR
jgi:hypothetical protein